MNASNFIIVRCERWVELESLLPDVSAKWSTDHVRVKCLTDNDKAEKVDLLGCTCLLWPKCVANVRNWILVLHALEDAESVGVCFGRNERLSAFGRRWSEWKRTSNSDAMWCADGRQNHFYHDGITIVDYYFVRYHGCDPRRRIAFGSCCRFVP